MPECPKCTNPVPPHAKHCPDCGAPQPIPPHAHKQEQDDTIHNILLNAHLLRIRGDIDSAINECVKALRIDTDNLEAHELVADMYRAQGKLEDAVHWYQLALDIDPDSRIIQAKLEEVENHAPAPHPNRSERATAAHPMLKISPATVMSGIIAVIVLSSMIFLAARSKHQNPPPPPSVSLTSPSTTNPVIPQGGITVEERPQTIQVSTTQESSLARELNAATLVKDYQLKIDNVTIDPRTNSSVITITVPYPTEENLAEVLVRGSAIVAKEAFSRDANLTNVTVRALSAAQSGVAEHPELYFVGDAAREATTALDFQTATSDNMLAVFQNAWWHEQLRQQ